MLNVEADGLQHQKTTLSATPAILLSQLMQAHQKWTTEDWKNAVKIQMLESEFGVNEIKAWIHPDFHQQFSLLVV